MQWGESKIIRLFIQMKNIFIPALAIFFGSCIQKDEAKTSTPLKPVPFTAVHLNDQFWAPKIEINLSVVIPSAFQDSK